MHTAAALLLAQTGQSFPTGSVFAIETVSDQTDFEPTPLLAGSCTG